MLPLPQIQTVQIMKEASAYLGQAGVSFGNFLKTGATDNLTETLGISKLSSASIIQPETADM